MTTPTTETIAPPQDRIERLADRVLAVGKACAAQGDGRTFTVDAIYDEMSEISRQRLSDAIKTLKDARRIHATGMWPKKYPYPQDTSERATALSIEQGGRLV